MNLKSFIILVAIVATAYALGFLIIPKFIISLYGVDTAPAAILGYRFSG